MPAWTIPAVNNGLWAVGAPADTPGGIGIPGGIDQYLAGGVNDRALTGTVHDVTQAPYNADPTGVADVKAAVAAAWAAASPGDVIFFPPGTYRFATGYIYLGYKDNITFRGASSSSVTFVIETTQTVFQWGSPGEVGFSPRTVTGTKTKGTTTLNISDTSPYAVGDHVAVAYENETDNARIQAGANPVWTSLGWPEARKMYARVRAKTGTTITIDPGLPADATNLALTVYTYPLTGQNWITSGIGVENLSISYASSNHPLGVFAIGTAEYCWVYDVRFLNWSMNNANGSCIGLGTAYRCEIRKCYFNAAPGVSSDGAIGIGYLTSSAIYDNIFKGGFGTWIYDNGNSHNNVYAFNYAPNLTSIFHNAHPSLNLVEGNYAYNHQSDGYHGSSSNNTIYSNFLHGGGVWYSLMLHRFKRQYVAARNFFGEDGVTTGRIAWGWPNFNPFATGFAGPTGLSDQVGQPDLYQPGYAENAYIIQAGDVSVGDFWSDWEITATLTTRISDTEAVFTVNGGTWFTGSGGTGGGIWPRIWWNNKANGAGAIAFSSVTAVSGNLVTISVTTGDPFPAEGTVVQMYTGPGGWQERDLDVKASSTLVHNYFGSSGGTGAIQNSSADTFPASLAWSSKPAWVGSLSWPIFDVDSVATADPERLPAGYRDINGNEDYLGGVSTPQYSPAPGNYGSTQSVTITSSTPSATIYYTTNGATPTTSSTLYTGPVTISATTTLKAIAIKAGMTDSSVQSGTYTFVSAPSAPSSLSATAISSSQINLAWTDNANNETGFRIEQKIGAGGAWNEIYTTAANATSYSVTGLSPSTQYYFRIEAFNGGGDSAYSNEANATTSPSGVTGRKRSARFPRKSILV